MVVKTERCAFSEFLVFPGHGMKFIRKDGQPLILGSSKSKSLYMQRLKPSKLQWTQGWRRLNKKALVDTISKKRTRKNTKVQRAIVGVSLDEVIKTLLSLFSLFSLLKAFLLFWGEENEFDLGKWYLDTDTTWDEENFWMLYYVTTSGYQSIIIYHVLKTSCHIQLTSGLI